MRQFIFITPSFDDPTFNVDTISKENLVEAKYEFICQHYMECDFVQEFFEEREGEDISVEDKEELIHDFWCFSDESDFIQIIEIDGSIKEVMEW